MERRRSIRAACVLAAGMVCCQHSAIAQRTVRFPLPDRAVEIDADLYGTGTRGVVLAHGGRFHKESWKNQAEAIANAGFLVLAVGFRGDGLNPDGSPGSFGSDEANASDVLAAVSYLRRNGAQSIYGIGASLGGDAIAGANARSSEAGPLTRLAFLGSDGGDAPEQLKGRKLFLVAREDSNGAGPRLKPITEHYARATEPKKLVVVEGSAHAQFLFSTNQGPRVMSELLRFLSEP